MEIIKVGGKIPQRVNIDTEGAAVMLNEHSFDVYIGLETPTQQEAKLFRKGTFRYGIYTEYAIPFLLLEMIDKKVYMDCSFNFCIQPDISHKFLQSDGNAVMMVLYDTKTRVVHGLRQLGFPQEAMDNIRQAGKKQMDIYKNRTEVKRWIAKSEQEWLPWEKIKEIPMWEFKSQETI